MKTKNYEKLHSSHETEAWADMKDNDPETKVNIPSERAVEDAKEWVEENEL